MTFAYAVRHVRNNPKDAWHFVTGTFRNLVYRRWPHLIRWHIAAQYEQRKTLAMDCYLNGSCICCGCDTPSLFFASKACSAGKPDYRRCLSRKPCYPRLMSRTEWYWHLMKTSKTKTDGTL